MKLEEFIMSTKVIRITKGRDTYLQVTPLSEYAKQKGWQVLKEYVDISIPTGKEMKQLLEDMKRGKIIVVNSDSQGKEGKYGK